MSEWFVNLLRLSIGSACGVLLLIGILYLLKGKVKWQWQYNLWVMMLLSFMMPIWLSIPIAIEVPGATMLEKGQLVSGDKISLQVQQGEIEQTVGLPIQSIDMTEQVIGETFIGQQEAVKQKIPIEKLIPIEVVWLLGALICGAYRLLCYRIFKKELMLECHKVDGRALTIYRQMADKLQLGEVPVLMTTRKKQSPMMVGIKNPMLIVACIDELKDDTLELMLLHELIHFKRKDIWIKWVGFVVGTIHWFNPFTYLTLKKLHETCEMSCDEKVIAYLEDKQTPQYIQVLLSVAAYRLNKSEGLVTSMANSKEKLKDRCMHIQMPIKKRTVYQLVSIGLGAMLLVITSFLSGCYTVEKETEKEVTSVVNTELPKEEEKQVEESLKEEVFISEDGQKVYVRDVAGERTLFEYIGDDKDAKITECLVSGKKNPRDKYYVYIQLTTQGLEKIYVVDKEATTPVEGADNSWIVDGDMVFGELSNQVAESVFGAENIPQELTSVGMTKVENVQWITSGPILLFDFSMNLGNTVGELKGSANYTLDTNSLIVDYKEVTNEAVLIEIMTNTLGIALTTEEQKTYDALNEQFTVEVAKTLNQQQVVKIWINAILNDDKELYQALSERDAYVYNHPLKLKRTIGTLQRMSLILNGKAPYRAYAEDMGTFRIGNNMGFRMMKNEERYWVTGTMGPMN